MVQLAAASRKRSGFTVFSLSKKMLDWKGNLIDSPVEQVVHGLLKFKIRIKLFSLRSQCNTESL
jgi:hypothetical protein